MHARLPLATKCLLVFGGAAVLIVVAALVPPWLRMTTLVHEGQLELSRRLVDTWLRAEVVARDAGDPSEPPATEARELTGIAARRVILDADGNVPPGETGFAAEAARALAAGNRLDMQEWSLRGRSIEYRYARIGARQLGQGEPKLNDIVVLERRSPPAARLLGINTLYLLSAGCAVLGLALLTFYFITRKLVLVPVRELKQSAERVREGNLQARSELSTGDEFEDLAEAFNLMLADLQGSQDQVRSINLALDLKLNELAQSNVALYEAAKLKGEFLASVSHELRTPLNSILGFTDLLLEYARSDLASAEAGSAMAIAAGKRVRYLENIQSAGRNLLELINSLLEMAKIEAGKIDLRAEPVSLRDLCEALAGLIYPLADKKGVQVRVEAADDLPVIITDAKKLQQILFNFLSNAVKFIEPIERSGRQGLVILRAERLVSNTPGQGGEDRVRLSVIDNGPGIPHEEQRRIFDRFYRVEQGHAREHAGTGLGLAIARELAQMLRAEIQVVSEPGNGSMFSMILPLEIDPTRSGPITPGRVHAGAG